ncbi:2005_t:CDS:2 [Cetraspora pellucida]|uniref:2005_t:CDS:1 n=1 Tax=Cetraspora pellucida TaxID=1433469 RepID=A0ACA9M288_9GLOM|nr:2005_t:CDS:2 [Cetraspora pellucida]
MSNKVIITSVKVVGEREGLVDFYGQVIVQTSNEDAIVTIEYTTEPWITDNSVIAKRLQTFSNEQILYNFEFSIVKISNLPLHLKFRARCDIANSSFWTNYNYEYLYNEGIPKEIIFHEEELKKECTICTEDVGIKIFLNITEQCSHHSNICSECVRKYIKHEIENNRKFKISCPAAGCDKILSEENIKRFASEEIFKRYEQSTLNSASSQIPTFQSCLNPNCESGRDHYNGDKVPIMTCNSCGQKSDKEHRQREEERRRDEEFRGQDKERRRREKDEHKRQKEDEKRLTKLQKNEDKRLSKLQKDEDKRLSKLKKDEDKRLSKLQKDEDKRLSKLQKDEEKRLSKLQKDEQKTLQNESESYVNQLKLCPKCMSKVEKNDGDGHTTCKRLGCGYEFCWM